MKKQAIMMWLIIVVSSIAINSLFLRHINIKFSIISLSGWIFFTLLYLEANLVANKIDKMLFYERFVMYNATTFIIFSYLLLPYYYGFFTSIAEHIIYFLLLIFLLFFSTLIYDGNKVVSIIEKSIPLATLATIALGVVQFYSQSLGVEVEKNTLVSVVALASWSGRFLLYGTMLLILYLIFNETIDKFDEEKVIGKKKIIINKIRPVYNALKITIPLIFFASIYLLLKSLLVVVKVT